MARTDPTIYMRIPQELKDALDAASAENKRSLTAEVVARLEDSLFKKSSSNGVPHEIAAYITALQNQSVMLDMRADMLKMRLESIGARVIAISQRTVGLDTSTLTDAELEQMEAEIEDLREAESEMVVIRGDLNALQEQRQEVLQHIKSLKSAVSTKVSDLEKVLAEAAARGLKNPADH